MTFEGIFSKMCFVQQSFEANLIYLNALIEKKTSFQHSCRCKFRFTARKTSGFDRVDLQKGIKNYGSLYLACNDRKAFFTSSDQSRYTLWSCQNVCDALSYPLDNIYIRFGTKLYRQIVGIPMGTNCAPVVADLFLYCYERDFMDSLNHDN